MRRRLRDSSAARTSIERSESTPSSQPSPPSSLKITVAFGGLLGTLAAGYGVLFTVVDDFNTEYGISESAIGLVIGIGFLAGFVSQVLIAPLADRGYARRVVLFGLALNVTGLLLMAFGTSLAPILVGRLVSGLGIGAAAPAIRRIVILADPDNLGTNLGRLLAADVFGFSMGPVVSAVLVGPFDIWAPFVVIAVAAVVLGTVVARVPVNETAADQQPSQRLAFDLLRNRSFAGAAVMAGAVFVMIGGFDALWALVHDELGTAEWLANIGITVFAIPLIILGPFGGRTAQRFGPFRLATIGLTIGAAFMFSYGLLPTGAVIVAVGLFHGISDGLTTAAPAVAAGMVVAADRQAGAQGMLGAAQAIMAGTTAVITGAVYEAFGRTAAYSVIAALMITLVGLGAWLARDSWSLRQPLAAVAQAGEKTG